MAILHPLPAGENIQKRFRIFLVNLISHCAEVEGFDELGKYIESLYQTLPKLSREEEVMEDGKIALEQLGIDNDDLISEWSYCSEESETVAEELEEESSSCKES